MGHTIGIDVGGTKIAGGVVDAEGRVLDRRRVESPAQDSAAIEKAIVDLVVGLCADHPVDAVGVSAAAFVDNARSTVVFAPNLAWRDVELRADLERALDLRVVVENDGNAAAWGEFAHGAAVDADDLLMVAVGTGVGGGLVLDGALHRGSFGIAGEIGHLRVVPGGRPCPCGQRGCLEQYASGTALVEDTRALVSAGSPDSEVLLTRARGEVGAIDGPMVTELARQGDRFALARIEQLGQWLGEGVASLVAVLDPGVVVVGGGVSEAGDLLLDPVRAAFAAHLTGGGHRPVAEVRVATLGNDAGLIGAADLARR
ncbi:ROK family glucokinase [Nocardioides sp. MJB4]|uniref:Glucokinase n=2 Tax=Nocardioides donggukensis TaxID=2774019 RepID=A0A927Q1Y3_9ACTN|nr:ROK family glucokinase [Nocardioides donggukensis]